MDRLRITAAGVTLLLTAIAGAAQYKQVKINFQTLECDGSRGYASVDADRLIRAQRVACAADDPVPEVYQVLIDGPGGESAGYTVYNASESEVTRIFQEVEAYQKDKREFLRKGTHITID